MTIDKRQLILKTALSMGVSLLVLAAIMRLPFGGEADAQPQWSRILRHTAPRFVALYVVFSLVQAFFRAVRYRLLLRAAAERSVPSLGHTFLVTLARNMFVDLLPGRMGELSYIAMMNKGYRVSGRACVSSLTVGFLFDLIALTALLGVLAVFQIATAGVPGWLLYALFGLVVVVAVVTVALFTGIRVFTAVARRILGRTGQRRLVAAPLLFFDDVADALEFTRRSGVLPGTLGLSLLVRVAKYAGFCCLFYGVTRVNFPGLSGASVPGVLCALIAAEGGASLPVPAFMSFGTYEAGGLLALTVLGFPAAASRIALLALHIWSQCVDYALGGAGLALFFALTNVRRSSAAPLRGLARRHGMAALAGLTLLGGFGFFGLQYRNVRKTGAMAPSPKGVEVAPNPRESTVRRTVAGGVRGFVVWSSNRFGNHDILIMTLPDLSIAQLTTHPHVDTFPRISPDGKKIVFCRSREPWVSQRNDVPWDIVLLDLTRNEERLLAANGNVPTWSESGGHVYFQRDGGTFVAHDLSTGQETVLFRAGSDAVPDGVRLQTPSFSGKHKAMAVTLRGKRRQAAVFFADGGKPIDISSGACQLAWAPGSSYLYYVDGGRQKTAVWRCDPKGKEKRRWLDLPGEFSHEYFPKLSNDGRYLVFGASTGGHEHDTADYEIFLWRLGSPPEEAARLTFHTGNDGWPDLFVP